MPWEIRQKDFSAQGFSHFARSTHGASPVRHLRLAARRATIIVCPTQKDRRSMPNTGPKPTITALLERYDAMGGVIDYVFLDAPTSATPAEVHRQAALAGMQEIDRRLEQVALKNATPSLPISKFRRVRWDPVKLTGGPISLTHFMGTFNTETGERDDEDFDESIIDGYRGAFFHPPYSLRATLAEQKQLFEDINRRVLGWDPPRAEIFRWSNNWSTYFDWGHEWWGAYFWTVRGVDSPYIVAVGASSTD
jgi:hypothetical protein